MSEQSDIPTRKILWWNPSRFMDPAEAVIAEERTYRRCCAHTCPYFSTYFTGLLGTAAAPQSYLVYKDKSRYVTYQALQPEIFTSGILLRRSAYCPGMADYRAVVNRFGWLKSPDSHRADPEPAAPWLPGVCHLRRGFGLLPARTSNTGWSAIGPVRRLPTNLFRRAQAASNPRGCLVSIRGNHFEHKSNSLLQCQSHFGDCKRSKRIFSEMQVPYLWYDLDKNSAR